MAHACRLKRAVAPIVLAADGSIGLTECQTAATWRILTARSARLAHAASDNRMEIKRRYTDDNPNNTHAWRADENDYRLIRKIGGNMIVVETTDSDTEGMDLFARLGFTRQGTIPPRWFYKRTLTATATESSTERSRQNVYHIADALMASEATIFRTHSTSGYIADRNIPEDRIYYGS